MSDKKDLDRQELVFYDTLCKAWTSNCLTGDCFDFIASLVGVILFNSTIYSVPFIIVVAMCLIRIFYNKKVLTGAISDLLYDEEENDTNKILPVIDILNPVLIIGTFLVYNIIKAL